MLILSSVLICKRWLQYQHHLIDRLEHSPGESQVDFGCADFYENGKLHHEAKYLVLSFPYSNGGYLQLNYGENMECLLEVFINTIIVQGTTPLP